ncbi:hypothetical protein ACHAXA_010091 [Cyclostephanos tholiformis]|uniref:Protein kinase domain-containing protein n=1 Tax=Cyclostephanos tholiformis TaxID=382380 RepID=A0ABD3RUW3_9STRA
MIAADHDRMGGVVVVGRRVPMSLLEKIVPVFYSSLHKNAMHSYRQHSFSLSLSLSPSLARVRIMYNSKLSKQDDEAQLREVEILRSLNPDSFRNSARQSYRLPSLKGSDVSNNDDHDDDDDFEPKDNGIINLIDFYPSPTTYHIVLELARGGDVFDRLAGRKTYTEKNARDFARSLFRAVHYIHDRGIAHRDIKPENLLLMGTNDDVRGVRLADFGLARRFLYDGMGMDDGDYDEMTSMSTQCGTPAFVPPEIILGRRYGPKCDMWSAGCTLFMLLSGRPPFSAKKHGKEAMFRSIRAGDFVFYDDDWSNISMSAKKLILGLLNVDTRARLSPREALNSEWMTTKDDVLRRRSLESSLVKIIAKRKLKGAISAVMYAVGGKFWDISASSFMREDLRSEGAVIADVTKVVAAAALTGNDERADHFAFAFDKFYCLHRELQFGKCATVWEGTSIETGRTHAIKEIRREGLTQLEDAAVMNEVSILRSLRHKNIVPLLDFFEAPDRFYLVMEKCNGGDVLDKVASIEHYTEKNACQFSRGLLEGVQFMHSRGIAHRDLKPQNLLLECDADNTSVKICDFGFAKRVHMPQSLTTLCGSLHYVAPELLKNHPYDESADMWSVGVVIFFLLAGYLPFHHRDQNELFKMIRLGKFSFNPAYWSGISEEATAVITHLLDVDPTTRYTSMQALKSDWIIREPLLMKHNLANSLTGIVKESTRLKGVVRSVQWMMRSEDHLDGKSEPLVSSLTVDGVDFDSLSQLANIT